MRKKHILGLTGIFLACFLLFAGIGGATMSGLWHTVHGFFDHEEAPITVVAMPETQYASNAEWRAATAGDDVELAKAAVYALSNASEDGDLVNLIEVAHSAKHIEVRKAAVYQLGNSETDGAIKVLMDIAETDESEEVRKAAVYAIGNNESNIAVEALAHVVNGDAGAEVRKAAVYALGNIATPRARKVLLKVISSSIE